MKLKYLKLCGKLKELGWFADATTVCEHIEVITHEIGHIVSVTQKRPVVMDPKQVDELLKANLKTEAKLDKNEFITSAITKEVLHRIGIYTQDDEIVESLIGNIGKKTIEDLSGIRLTATTDRTVLHDRKKTISKIAAIKCEELRKTSKIQGFADRIMKYYDEVLNA